MKKFTATILSLCLLVAMVATSAISAFTAEKDFVADFLEHGKLQTPEAPYIVDETYGNHTALKMWFYQPDDMVDFGLTVQKHEEAGDGYFLEEQYGLEQFSKYYQVDAKFNDGEWLSAGGTWDKINENGEIYYGENVYAYNLAFLNACDMQISIADKLQSFEQCWLVYFDAENAENGYFKPFVKTSYDEYGETLYYFDFGELTISYRIRTCIQYLEDKGGEYKEWTLLTSDWSDETSFGKNGKQEELKMPEKIDAPVLSEFELTANEFGSGDIKYFATIPDSLYQATRYEQIVNDAFEPYYIDAQVKINDADWVSCYVGNSTWFNNGYRYVNGQDLSLKATDDAWLRIRICDANTDNPVTEWSNVIGTKALEAPTEPPTTEPPAETTTIPPTTQPTTENTTLPTTEPTTESTTVPPVKFMLGDVDFNGRITAYDARLALRLAAKLDVMSDDVLWVADVNKDGKVNAADARIILRVSAKLQAMPEY